MGKIATPSSMVLPAGGIMAEYVLAARLELVCLRCATAHCGEPCTVKRGLERAEHPVDASVIDGSCPHLRDA